MKLKLALTLAILMLTGSCARISRSNENGLKPRTSAVQVGEIAPDFTLPDEQNRKVTLSATRGIPTVLVFYRGYW
jgi:cytochrome oxidase Cu insertion factor (SCO1/SenC/PrrC family)